MLWVQELEQHTKPKSINNTTQTIANGKVIKLGYNYTSINDHLHKRVLSDMVCDPYHACVSGFMSMEN